MKIVAVSLCFMRLPGAPGGDFKLVGSRSHVDAVSKLNQALTCDGFGKEAKGKPFNRFRAFRCSIRPLGIIVRFYVIAGETLRIDPGRISAGSCGQSISGRCACDLS